MHLGSYPNRSLPTVFFEEAEKGGDIDLLVETDRKLENRIAMECRVASELQIRLGDQKIDVIIVDPETTEQPIHKIARQTGVII